MQMLYLIWILFVPLLAAGQHKEEQAVAAAVEVLRETLIDPTESSLLRIASPDLTYGHSGGLIEDRQAFIRALVSGESDFTAIRLSDQTIKVTGATAWVRHTLRGDTHNKGKAPGKVDLYVLLVFTKKGKEWILLARQAVKIP